MHPVLLQYYKKKFNLLSTLAVICLRTGGLPILNCFSKNETRPILRIITLSPCLFLVKSILVYQYPITSNLKFSMTLRTGEDVRPNPGGRGGRGEGTADPLIRQLGWNKLDNQRKFHKAVMVHKSLAPDYTSKV